MANFSMGAPEIDMIAEKLYYAFQTGVLFGLNISEEEARADNMEVGKDYFELTNDEKFPFRMNAMNLFRKLNEENLLW